MRVSQYLIPAGSAQPHRAVGKLHVLWVEKVYRVSSFGISVKIQNLQKMPGFGATGLKCKKKMGGLKDTLRLAE